MTDLDKKTINTLRVLSAECVQKANSGHPGLPLGAAAAVYTLWARHLRHSPANPDWADRDRFILSAGHGSALLYTLLHLFGYPLSMEDLKQFRQWGSKTPGHPEYKHTVGIETTTGPLGQGIANGVGMAIAEAHLRSKFNKEGFVLVDHYTYVLAGDGCMMEGISSEAASLAGTLGLGKLIVLYDSNHITIEGRTEIAFRENVAKRFEAYGWQVLKVEDGNHLEAIDDALTKAREETTKPSLIEISTIIGYGCAPKEGTASVHGEPLGEDNLNILKAFLGFDTNPPFTIPSDVQLHMHSMIQELNLLASSWNAMREQYQRLFPSLAQEWEQWHQNVFPTQLASDVFEWILPNTPAATRAASGDILNRLAKHLPNLIGGSADLAPSTKTLLNGAGHFSPDDFSGRNMHFGVREHAMAGIANGMAAHGGLIPFVSTFFVFSDYMKPSMRLSAIMQLPVIYVFTHDSIGVGEDGPTHQPVEQLAALRSIPGFIDFRPADYKETLAAWICALSAKNRPTALVLTRQNLPPLQQTGKDALHGGYVLIDSHKPLPDCILIATGSEVHLAASAHSILTEKGVDARVVSMPSVKLFEDQSASYKQKILPSEVTARVIVEAGSSYGWHKYAGSEGVILSIDTFGASAPADKLFDAFGLTVDNVVSQAMALVRK